MFDIPSSPRTKMTLFHFLLLSAIMVVKLGEAVHKSAFDDKEYLTFTIPENGLDVLVISKPGLDKASAAMDVRTGYFCDPETRPGLAHFLEHMLFMASITHPFVHKYLIICELLGNGEISSGKRVLSVS